MPPLLVDLFAAMRAEDQERVLVTAYVHEANDGGIRAAARLGITPLIPRDGGYLLLLGEVPV
jgi:hypothetical protein